MVTIIVDSNFISHRAKHSMHSMTYGEKSTGVVFGFLSTIKTLAMKFESNNFVFVWDSGRSNRKELYPLYKKNREKRTPEQIALDDIAYPQFSLLRTKILPKLGFKNIFIQTGFEGDDIAASIVNDGSPPEKKVVIAGDDDFLQLLEWCILYNPSTKETISRKGFEKEYGIRPQLWADVKALAGCPSDNISGVYGVGIKKALAYIKGELTKGKIYKKIQAEGEAIKKINYPLVRLPLEGVGKFSLVEDAVFHLDDFLDVCEDYGFRSFLKGMEFQNWKQLFNLK